MQKWRAAVYRAALVRHQVGGYQTNKQEAESLNRVDSGRLKQEREEQATNGGDDFLPLPDEIRRLKTMKLPDHMPKSEAELAAHPMAATLQQWFIVPLMLLFYVILKMVRDPFGDGGYKYVLTKRETDLEEHFEIRPNDVVDVTRERETRRQLREMWRRE